VPETCRAKSTSKILPSWIKLAFLWNVLVKWIPGSAINIDLKQGHFVVINTGTLTRGLSHNKRNLTLSVFKWMRHLGVHAVKCKLLESAYFKGCEHKKLRSCGLWRHAGCSFVFTQSAIMSPQRRNFFFKLDVCSWHCCAYAEMRIVNTACVYGRGVCKYGNRDSSCRTARAVPEYRLLNNFLNLALQNRYLLF